MKKKWIHVSIVIAIILILGGGFYLNSVHKDKSGEKISIRLDWLHQVQFAGFYFADKAGFYKDEDLDVTLNPGGMNSPAIQLVASNSDQFGMAAAEQILSAREKGVPVVAIAAIYRKNPFVMMALKDSGIDSVQEFWGKKIGVKYGDADEYIYRSMLKNAGLSSDDVKEVPAQFDMTPLFTGKIDVWPDYITGAITAEEKGYQVNIIWPKDYGINMPGGLLFTTEKMIQEKPDVVRKFISATIKGWQEALADQELAVSYTLQYNDELNKEREAKKIKVFASLLKPDDKPIGFMDKQLWESIQKFFLKQGFLSQTVDIDKTFTTKFLP